jgi:hypothetical protein
LSFKNIKIITATATKIWFLVSVIFDLSRKCPILYSKNYHLDQTFHCQRFSTGYHWINIWRENKAKLISNSFLMISGILTVCYGAHPRPQGLSAARVLPTPWDTRNRKCKKTCSIF